MKTKEDIVRILATEFAYHRFCGMIAIVNKDKRLASQEECDKAAKLAKAHWKLYIEEAELIYEEIMNEHVTSEDMELWTSKHKTSQDKLPRWNNPILSLNLEE